ncbi:MAG: ADP-ribosylglycohydrolase family protein [Sulfurimonas sp.]|uniref:ADP-ribosylglycohydrolase family protein n=1 Tax=Sulfurimonas sp. TaxID=2022749 RepID=UPI002605952D|nr:ADP-ribosylglycohydrolase family protein [Sulfurimonas sp.]MCW8894879.1 ADP-ribosylglycohydrolase family protein [Sulfurimonas sp.]MCW8953711.1 ADP-ribosylglycohydrolase family protein [Sulfurimonas sp.]MCW9067735.1 ADP-ribosylglycohydrolase family protein [Sulfurimonas sp.]
MDAKIKNSILASLTADAYALGAHWIYDEEDLDNLPIDWQTLNDAQSIWHKGKTKGDFTHYGDQALYLLEYMSKNREFNQEDYYSFWKEKMSKYDGYIDGATRNALVEMGSTSSDLSICGRIAPLLIHVYSKEEFLSRVKDFTSITHNSELAHLASQFFAELLWESKENQDIKNNIQTLKIKYPKLAEWIDEGVNSKDIDTFDAIRGFGPACGIDGGFSGVIHLLSIDDDFKTLMINNSKAGGDSSARFMVVAQILGSQDGFENIQELVDDINEIQKIEYMLK